jgi:hypothetical protein
MACQPIRGIRSIGIPKACTDESRLFGNRWLPQYAHGVSNRFLSFSSNYRFLMRELHLGKLSETVVVHGNAPHHRSRFLVSHLIGNRARFLCTKAPMRRVPESGWHRISGAKCSGDLLPKRDSHKVPSSITRRASFFAALRLEPISKLRAGVDPL